MESQTTGTTGTGSSAAAGGSTIGAVRSLPYPIVGSGQTLCYGATAEIQPPAPGEDFYGQDAQQKSNSPSYALSADGLSVTDNVTGLVWQQSPDTDGDGAIDLADKMTYEEALAYPATLNEKKFGGYDDWRLPTIKELYSLILFVGTDPNPMAASSEGEVPFLDTEFFAFAYGDLTAGERIIDSQYASSTKYVSTTMDGSPTLFGVNFADGRIKGYGLTMPNGSTKKFVVSCVRGNPGYGQNDFADNGDGTITDKATGLMWAQDDSGEGLDWQEALAWAQEMNAQGYLGHSDWRVPECQGTAEHHRLHALARHDRFRGHRPAVLLRGDHQRGGPGGFSLLLDQHDARGLGRPGRHRRLHGLRPGYGLHGAGSSAAKRSGSRRPAGGWLADRWPACEHGRSRRQVDGRAWGRRPALRPEGGRPCSVPIRAWAARRRDPHLQLRAAGEGRRVSLGGRP